MKINEVRKMLALEPEPDSGMVSVDPSENWTGTVNGHTIGLHVGNPSEAVYERFEVWVLDGKTATVAEIEKVMG